MSSDSKKPSSKNSPKFSIIKLLKAPVKILAKARDLYVRRLVECSSQVGYGHGGYGIVMGCPTGQYVPSLPRSFSVSSTRSDSHHEDYGELMRFASARSLNGRKVDPDFFVNKHRKQLAVPNGTSRSRSVGIERIDEERPLDFEHGSSQADKTNVYLRSKSCAAVVP